jgi:hypothetical protein
MFTKVSKQLTAPTPISLVQRCRANLPHIGIMTGGMVLGLSLNLLASQEAKAASFNFTRIADSSGSLDVFGGFSLNNQGSVAFKASLDGGGEGIFTGNGMNVTSVAQTNNYFKGFQSTPDINDLGTVAFDAILNIQANTDVRGIFTGNGSTITPIDIPIGNVFKNVYAPSINNAGTVAYVGDGIEMPLFFERVYEAVSINDQGLRVSINEGRSGLAINILTSNGSNYTGIDFILSSSYPIGLGLYRESSETSFSINNTGTLAFRGRNNAQNKQGVYKKNGTFISAVIEENENSNSSVYSNISINNNGSVAFLRSFVNEGTGGIFTGDDLLNDRVISTGDSLLGSTVTGLSFSRKGFNDAGQVAFFAKFTDGSSGIFRADPVSPSQSVPEPSSGLAVLMFGTLGAGSLLRQKQKSVSKVASDGQGSASTLTISMHCRNSSLR